MDWILGIFLTLFVLSLISAGLVAYRYRRQIQTAWLMFTTFRKIRQQTKPKKKKNLEPKSKTTDSPLVRCSKCQKWTPQDGAVKLKSNFFCSHRCMEESFDFRF